MHHFIYATKDSWISSGSNKLDGETFTDQNFGQDPILEVKKSFYDKSFDYQTRALVSFAGSSFTEMSQSVASGEIRNPKFYLRLYEAAGNQETSLDYTLAAYVISQSWDEGVGKSTDEPKTISGTSWQNRNNYQGSTAVSWSYLNGMPAHGGNYLTGSRFRASQSFSSATPDVNMDVTDIVNKWLQSGSVVDNNGFLIRISGSQETNTSTLAQLNFFSNQTNTVYSPKLEVRWDDHKPCTGSNTGSLVALTMSGLVDNSLYMKGLRDSYRESEKVKFRVGCRKRYTQKTFSTSVQTLTSSYITEGSGSYSILDIGTGETVVPFSSYTSMSCDSTSNYFIQWLNGFYPNRIYKIIYKLKNADGQQVIYDNNFEFKIRS